MTEDTDVLIVFDTQDVGTVSDLDDNL